MYIYIYIYIDRYRYTYIYIYIYILPISHRWKSPLLGGAKTCPQASSLGGYFLKENKKPQYSASIEPCIDAPGRADARKKESGGTTCLTLLG